MVVSEIKIKQNSEGQEIMTQNPTINLAKNYLFKVSIKTLEKGVKYVLR